MNHLPKKTSHFALYALLLALFLSAAPARADKLIYIFDASGSMWGQIEGVAKIDIAKKALSELVKDIPDAIDVGLVAYGHRTKGDCADIEVLIPPNPLDRSALVAAVQGIKPKGKTPMADSIRMVADMLKGEEDAAIILISDGKETCDPDPCAAVLALKQSGISFTLHVIGFDVSGETEQQLQCMAKAGGGDYIPAKNAGDFGVAVTEVQQKVTKNLIVSATRNGQPIAVDVFILAGGRTEENRASTLKGPAAFSLVPGTYDVRIVDAWGQEGTPEQTVSGVVVTEGEVTEVAVKFGGGKLEVMALKSGVPFAADVLVTDASGKTISKQTYDSGPAMFELPGGAYQVRVKDEWGSGAIVNLGMVQVGGPTVKKTASFDVGELHIWATKDGQPYVADAYVIDASGKSVAKQTYGTDPATFVLMAGTYQVRVKDEWGDGSVQETTATIQPGKTTPIKVDF